MLCAVYQARSYLTGVRCWFCSVWFRFVLSSRRFQCIFFFFLVFQSMDLVGFGRSKNRSDRQKKIDWFVGGWVGGWVNSVVFFIQLCSVLYDRFGSVRFGCLVYFECS